MEEWTDIPQKQQPKPHKSGRRGIGQRSWPHFNHTRLHRYSRTPHFYPISPHNVALETYLIRASTILEVPWKKSQLGPLGPPSPLPVIQRFILVLTYPHPPLCGCPHASSTASSQAKTLGVQSLSDCMRYLLLSWK